MQFQGIIRRISQGFCSTKIPKILFNNSNYFLYNLYKIIILKLTSNRNIIIINL